MQHDGAFQSIDWKRTSLSAFLSHPCFLTSDHNALLRCPSPCKTQAGGLVASLISYSGTEYSCSCTLITCRV